MNLNMEKKIKLPNATNTKKSSIFIFFLYHNKKFKKKIVFDHSIKRSLHIDWLANFSSSELCWFSRTWSSGCADRCHRLQPTCQRSCYQRARWQDVVGAVTGTIIRGTCRRRSGHPYECNSLQRQLLDALQLAAAGSQTVGCIGEFFFFVFSWGFLRVFARSRRRRARKVRWAVDDWSGSRFFVFGPGGGFDVGTFFFEYLYAWMMIFYWISIEKFNDIFLDWYNFFSIWMVNILEKNEIS